MSKTEPKWMTFLTGGDRASFPLVRSLLAERMSLEEKLPQDFLRISSSTSFLLSEAGRVAAIALKN